METERDVCLIDLGDASIETKEPIGPFNDGISLLARLPF